MLRRVLFAGGGTGGHVYMAVALAEELQRRHPDIELLFVGTERGMETRILPPRGYRLELIRVGGLNRVGGRRALRSLLQIPSSLLASWRIVRRFRPSVVVGVGGYAAGPVTVAAGLAGAPSLLIEPNACPGLTNRWLRRWVSRALVAYPEAARYYGDKAELTGVPIRAEFAAIAPVEPASPIRLLVLGGSQGSVGVNRLVGEALAGLDAVFEVTHQTGARDAERMRAYYADRRIEARVTEFLDPLPEALATADLVVSRAGASAVAEIAAAGRASVLIPFPHAADDHQRANARSLEKAAAAVLFEEPGATAEALAGVLRELAADPERLREMGEKARGLSPRDSTNRVINVMETISR